MRINMGIESISPLSVGADGNLIVRLSKKFYEKLAIFSAAYKITDRCVILINPAGESDVDVTFKPKVGHSRNDLQYLIDEFCNDVIDQQLRIDLEKQYGKLRNLIVEHAFAPISDLRSRLDVK